MIISLIAAVSDNYVIGKDNRLIWRLPADVKFFKEKTEGHHILTGRKNYLSIPEKFRPLQNRINIIVSRDKDFFLKNNPLSPSDQAGENYTQTVIVHSPEEGIEYARRSKEKELFVIGGGEIYRQTIDIADKLYITWVHSAFEGDTFFPDINNEIWKETYRMDHPMDEKHKFAYSFCIYEKRQKPK